MFSQDIISSFVIKYLKKSTPSANYLAFSDQTQPKKRLVVYRLKKIAYLNQHCIPKYAITCIVWVFFWGFLKIISLIVIEKYSYQCRRYSPHHIVLSADPLVSCHSRLPAKSIRVQLGVELVVGLREKLR